MIEIYSFTTSIVGWTCDYYALLAVVQITKENVDRFEIGQEIPCCQIRAEWTGQGKPSQLTHAVILKGAKKPNNFFYIELDSTPLVPDTKARELLTQAIYVFIGDSYQLLHHFQ